MSDPGLRALEHGHYSEQQGTLSPCTESGVKPFMPSPASPAPHLLLRREGLVARPLNQLLTVFQGGQQPCRPPLDTDGLLLVLHTQTALSILGDWRACRNARGQSSPPMLTRHSGHQSQQVTHLLEAARPPPCGPHPAVPPSHTPVCCCLRLGTCTSRLMAFLVGRGPGDTDTETTPSPSPRLGAAARGAGSGI